jgi:hypothetical protein
MSELEAGIKSSRNLVKQSGRHINVGINTTILGHKMDIRDVRRFR